MNEGTIIQRIETRSGGARTSHRFFPSAIETTGHNRLFCGPGIAIVELGRQRSCLDGGENLDAAIAAISTLGHEPKIAFSEPDNLRFDARRSGCGSPRRAMDKASGRGL